MSLIFIAYGLSFIIGILMLVRVFKASVLDGVLTFFIPLYFIVPLIKHWSDPDHDIKFHVLALFACAGMGFWALNRMTHDFASDPNGFLSGHLASASPQERQKFVQDMRDEGVAISAEDEKAIVGGNKEEVAKAFGHVMETARAKGLGEEYAGTDTPASGGGAARTRDAEFDNPRPVAVPDRPVEIMSYAEAARRAVFNRGRWTREATGFSVDVPARFRLISPTDARRLDQARGRAEDPRLMGWILHENLNLANPDIWHVTMRWHSDGWVGSLAFDPVQQLSTALANKTPAPRVAVSGGDLVGYAAVPQLEGQVLTWAEERVLTNSDTHVVDCHALRLGLRGMLEFSIVGMEPGSLALCQTTTRLLADKSSFLPGKEYVASAPAGIAAAPYTVATLPTHSY